MNGSAMLSMCMWVRLFSFSLWYWNYYFCASSCASIYCMRYTVCCIRLTMRILSKWIRTEQGEDDNTDNNTNLKQYTKMKILCVHDVQLFLLSNKSNGGIREHFSWCTKAKIKAHCDDALVIKLAKKTTTSDRHQMRLPVSHQHSHAKCDFCMKKLKKTKAVSLLHSLSPFFSA